MNTLLFLLTLACASSISTALVPMTDKHSTAALFYETLPCCPLLEELNLAYCDDIATAIQQLPEEQLLGLKKLNVGFTIMTVTQFYELLRRCPQLEELEADFCKDAATALLQLPVQQLAHSKKLNLMATDTTVAQLNSLLFYCPNLKELDVAFCKDATASVLLRPTWLLVSLKKLNLWETKPTVSQAQDIVNHLPDCTIIGLC